jgi:membrane-associated phospholipid phosphatase
MVDCVVVKYRTFLCHELIARSVSYIHGFSSIESFRSHQFTLISDSVSTIHYIQSYRNSFLDVLMKSVTFCGEEEFYLLFLPFTIWTTNFDFGVHLTLLVTYGFLSGNILKEIFELPRPPLESGLWRAHVNDEFGWPSTHSMNAVSNSLLLLWYFQRDTPLVLALASPVFITLLCTSRLYLGMHSKTDIRGGIGLGLFVFATYTLGIVPGLELYWRSCSLSTVAWTSFVSAALILLACPQPKSKKTPSFSQNGLIIGIVLGVVIGKRMLLEWDLTRLTLQEPSVGKLVMGYILMGLIRTVAKTVSKVVVEKVLGLPTQPPIKDDEATGCGEVELFGKDKDILGMITVKVFTYFSAALWIGLGCAWAWEEGRRIVDSWPDLYR